MKQCVKGKTEGEKSAQFSDYYRVALACLSNEFIDNFRPIVQRRRLEITAIGPHERMNFWIDCNLIEKIQIAQRAE